MQNESSQSRTLIMCALFTALNIVLGMTVGSLELPFYGDTLGTIFAGIYFGPVYGIVVGFLGSFLKDLIFSGMENLPFALVNMMIGLVVGLAYKKLKISFVNSLVIGLILSFLCALVGTPIGIAVYGGLTGTVSDVMVLFLKQSGASIFTASFIPKVINNLIDKVGSMLIAYLVVRQIGMKYKPACFFDRSQKANPAKTE